MTRPRSQTIGPLGRAPARVSSHPEIKPSQVKMAVPAPALPPREPPPERGAVARWVHGALVDNLGLKFLSIVLAVTVFLLVNTDKEREITARIGVSYSLPDDKALISDRVQDVHVVIKGPWRKLRNFDDRSIDRINLDLRNSSPGEIPITADLVHLPPGLSVASITPSALRVDFDRRVDKVVEVVPQVSGRPTHGYVAAEIKATPATARVRGAERIINALSTIRTRDISLDGHADAFDSTAQLLAPAGVEIVGGSDVAVHAQIDEELVTRKVPGLTVQVRGDDPAKWTIKPAQVDATLTGPLLAIEKSRATMVPIVKLATADKQREADVILDGLPPGIGAKISPERVKISPASH